MPSGLQLQIELRAVVPARSVGVEVVIGRGGEQRLQGPDIFDGVAELGILRVESVGRSRGERAGPSVPRVEAGHRRRQTDGAIAAQKLCSDTQAVLAKGAGKLRKVVVVVIPHRVVGVVALCSPGRNVPEGDRSYRLLAGDPDATRSRRESWR